MGFSVIPDGMAARDRFLYELGAFAHKASYQKKSGFRVVAIQKIEESWRDCRIRPVIKRERQLARRIRAPERRPEDLRPRINCSVGGNSRSSQQRGGRRFDEPGIHAPILARKEAAVQQPKTAEN